MTNLYPCILLTLALVGCTPSDMFEDVHIYPNTSLPLGTVQASDSSLFALAGMGQNMRVGADGVLNFVDSTSLILSKDGVGTPLFTIGDQHFGISQPLTPTPGLETIQLPDGLNQQFILNTSSDDQTIDKISFANCQITIDIDGLDVPGYNPHDMIITLPQVNVNGRTLSMYPGDVVTLGPDDFIAPLPGNTITCQFAGTVPTMSQLTGTVTILPGKVASVSGFFGRKPISIVTQIIKSPADFSNFMASAKYVYFANPKTVLDFNNSYDAPMMANITSITIDDRKIDIKAGRQIFYIAPKSRTQIIIDNSVTVGGNEFSQALTKDFKEMNITIESMLNPTATDLQDPTYIPSTTNSIKADDVLDGMFSMIMPLDCVMDDVKFGQKLAVDLQDLQAEDITYNNMTLALSGTNDLPMDMNIMASIRNMQTGLVVPLISNPVAFPSSASTLRPDAPGFQPGVVDKSNLITISLDQDKIDMLLKTDSIYLDIVASTRAASQKTPVKIYSPSKLDIHIFLGAKADMVIGK